jgi:threonyl-tRNA synthetase
VVVPVADRHEAYGDEVVAHLTGLGVRAALDRSEDSMGAKIRRHQVGKVPYQLVVGDAEVAARTVAVRPYRGEQRKDVPLDDFATELALEVQERRT